MIFSEQEVLYYTLKLIGGQKVRSDTVKYCKNMVFSPFLNVSPMENAALTRNLTWTNYNWLNTPMNNFRPVQNQEVRFYTVKYSKNWPFPNFKRCSFSKHHSIDWEYFFCKLEVICNTHAKFDASKILASVVWYSKIQ